MPETCGNSCDYYARQTIEIYQVLQYSVNAKAPRNIEIHLVTRQYLVSVVLFGMITCKHLKWP